MPRGSGSSARAGVGGLRSQPGPRRDGGAAAGADTRQEPAPGSRFGSGGSWVRFEQEVQSGARSPRSNEISVRQTVTCPTGLL